MGQDSKSQALCINMSSAVWLVYGEPEVGSGNKAVQLTYDCMMHKIYASLKNYKFCL
jgi:hypothetical protein